MEHTIIATRRSDLSVADRVQAPCGCIGDVIAISSSLEHPAVRVRITVPHPGVRTDHATVKLGVIDQWPPAQLTAVTV